MFGRKLLIFLLVLGVTVQSVQAEEAKDDDSRGFFEAGRRRGFFVRFDGGVGNTWVTSKKDGVEQKDNEGNLDMMIGLGYAPSDQVAINFSLKIAIYTSAFEEKESRILYFILGPLGPLFIDKHILAGVGVTYYFKSTAPSFFVEAGIGGATLSNPFDDFYFISDSYTGTGYYAGAGFEFAKHFNFELTYIYSTLDKQNYTAMEDWTAQSLMFTLGVMIY